MPAAPAEAPEEADGVTARAARKPRRRPAHRGAQLRKLLGMLRRLTADYWTVDELAEDLGVTRRTAWRYLAAIRAQCPLEQARGEGRDHATYYRLPRRWWDDERRTR